MKIERKSVTVGKSIYLVAGNGTRWAAIFRDKKDWITNFYKHEPFTKPDRDYVKPTAKNYCGVGAEYESEKDAKAAALDWIEGAQLPDLFDEEPQIKSVDIE